MVLWHAFCRTIPRMARIHPSLPLRAPLGAGDYRERELLRQLQEGLPDSFDVFHNLRWTSAQDGQQHFGEYDFVLVSPGGQLLILELKAGSVQADARGLGKAYGAQHKDIGQQVRRQHASLLDRIQRGHLPRVDVGTLLVLPDVHIQSEIVAYPRERIIDAGQMPQLCALVQAAVSSKAVSTDDRQRVLDFLANRFEVEPDVASQIGQVQQVSTQLASGLATWVPRIRHAQQTYQLEATAGSGKTQLALRLLRDAAAAGQTAQYVCYNRPLADHLARLAPTSCDVTTFHQLCRDHAERCGQAPDFAQPQVFDQMSARYLADAGAMAPRLDLLILDESQDLDPAWVGALGHSLRPQGRLYLMGDRQQQLYEREPFDLADAVQIECMDNFRSPQRVVQVINQLKLTPQPVQARSPHVGEVPGFHVYGDGQHSAMGQLNACLQQLWADGYTPQQVAVISWRGLQHASILQHDRLGGKPTRRYAGRHDAAGNPVWTEGELLTESLYRFKGQSAPAVVLCEVDFETLTDQDRRKLFVGLTRAQLRVELVLSAQAVQALMGVVG